MATRNDRQILSASDDLAKMMKQVLAEHAPDGHEVDVGPILSIIEDIFRCATAIPSNIDGVPNVKFLYNVNYANQLTSIVYDYEFNLVAIFVGHT